MKKVLCIDDDETVAKLIADVVEFCGYEPIVETDSVEATSRYIQNRDILAVLTDFMMPRMDGIDVLSVWQEQRPEVRRILITAAPQESQVREAGKSRIAQMVIAKPPMIADIKMALAWL